MVGQRILLSITLLAVLMLIWILGRLKGDTSFCGNESSHPSSPHVPPSF